jgi:hypothetical protein
MTRSWKNSFLQLVSLEGRQLSMIVKVDSNLRRATSALRAAFLSRRFFLKKTTYTPNPRAVDRTSARVPKMKSLTANVVASLRCPGVKSAGTSVLTFGSIVVSG